MTNAPAEPFTGLRTALTRALARRPVDEAADGREPTRLRLRDYFTLRPYGRSLITPAVSVWLSSAWVVILLMAGIEGFVWGAVGASLVPSASPWLAPPVAAFMFTLMFSIVWIVDSSLIMSERPPLRLRRQYALQPRGLGPATRWFAGIAVRVAIVAISLYVTAPFIEKLIRADDIEGYHKAQVEQYLKQRDATTQAQVRARAEQLDAGLTGRIKGLEQEIGRLSDSLKAEQQRRARIEAEYAPQIEVLTRDLADARGRVGDEVLGRDGRPEGYGPQARKWDARAKLIEGQLAQVQAERDQHLAATETTIGDEQQRLAERSDALQKVRVEQQQLMAQVTAEVAAQQPPPSPPRLTFAARSKALHALRSSPEEAGVPHFETVSGFAQAALGILFFALIALKLFEPTAVHAYYSETVQFQYRKYLAGGLAGIPGFEQHDDPTRRLSPAEFYRLWERYEADPDDYFERIKTVLAAEARVRRLQADQAYELELLERQRDDIDARLTLERRRREAELAARERELDLQLEEARKRLSGETRVEIERLAQQRREARRAHELALETLQQQFDAERARLDDELARRREEWEQQRAAEEAELRRQQEAFEDARRSARDDARRQQMAMDDQRRLREMEIERAAADKEREHERAGRKLRIEQTRALLADQADELARRRMELSELRVRTAQRNGGIDDTEAELRHLEERLQERDARIATLRERIDDAARAAPSAPSFWGGDPAQRTRRTAERRLKDLQRERDKLADDRERLHLALRNQRAEREALQQSGRELEVEIKGLNERLAEQRQRLDALLLARA